MKKNERAAFLGYKWKAQICYCKDANNGFLYNFETT
jgi:hypothetical protein